MLIKKNIEWCSARINARAAGAWNVQQRVVEQCWQKPCAGTYKCNVDATLFNYENKYGIGECIGSSTGSFHKSKTMCFTRIPTPEEAEGL